MNYSFSQRFDVPAAEAFSWCTDYKPDDWGRMGKKGTRGITRLNEDTIILNDTVTGDDGDVTKVRLVRLNPGLLAWTNTHIGGPNKHSQFWYEIVAEGKGRSRLDFTGLQLNYGRRPSETEVAKLGEKLRAEDSAMWVLLAKEMHNDLARPKRASPA